MKDWNKIQPLPKPEHPVLTPRGLMDPQWYAYFKSRDSITSAVPVLTLNDLADVEADAPADGDVLTWVDADGTWQPA